MKIITFGCRLNACESEIIEEFAQQMGIRDYTLINTCAVTAEAERKLRQTINRLYKENPDVKIILTGCAAELHPHEYMQMNGVVGIISNRLKLSKSEYEQYATGSCDLPVPNLTKVRGFLQIQNGCDKHCTYCVVRLTRGSNISFSKDDIVQQAKRLLAKGYKEIFLTGVNISSYGRDWNSGDNLASIIRHILKEVPSLQRLGLSSIDPADINDELIDVITSEERVLPHVHESIQSGDNMILKRMMRSHSREQVIAINQKMLQKRPDIIFGADIIVGFPTETDEMFENTKALLTEGNISLLHAFPFSKRPGTPAAKMPSVANKIINQRVKEIHQLSQDILQKKFSEYVGKQLTILAEDEFNAKTNSFLPVVSNTKLIAGETYIFHCTGFNENAIIGSPIRY